MGSSFHQLLTPRPGPQEQVGVMHPQTVAQGRGKQTEMKTRRLRERESSVSVGNGDWKLANALIGGSIFVIAAYRIAEQLIIQSV